MAHGKYACGTCLADTFTDLLLFTAHCCSPRQGRIFREVNEEASGPLTCKGPFQGPGRGASSVFTLPYIKKNANVRYLNLNRLLQGCVRQTVRNNIMLFFWILLYLWYLSGSSLKFAFCCDFLF